jgi:hypothetical protein
MQTTTNEILTRLAVALERQYGTDGAAQVIASRITALLSAPQSNAQAIKDLADVLLRIGSLTPSFSNSNEVKGDVI